MPYAFITHKKIIPRELDRRVHVTEEDKEYMLYLYDAGIAIREIARIFEGICTRRTIQFVIFPERLAHIKKLFIERRKDGRYKPTREKWTMIMREHRKYKQSIKDKLI